MNALKRLDSNSDKWFPSEQDQMRRIHRVYKESLSSSSRVSSSSTMTTTTTTTLDVPSTESFLPHDSCLRSDKDGLRPLHGPFKDYEAFIKSTSPEYWRGHFSKEEGHDRTLGELAESIVTHACQSQASRDLRVRHGSKPLGRYWRAKREHITPLALTMHELKLWATNRLRCANAMDESTFVDVGQRIRYVQGLQRKEVWGRTKSTLQQGMRPIAHDKLFRLLLTTREDLNRAKEYAFRAWCQRKSREKLQKLENLLKSVFYTEVKIVSLLGSFQTVVTEPDSARLQPTDLLNQVHNQIFVDYQGNFVNVCLKAMFEIPLVKCALLADFGGETDEKDPLVAIRDWQSRNLFCQPSATQLHAVPLLEDEMPLTYCKTWEALSVTLTTIDKKKAKLPLKPAVWATTLKTKTFAEPADARLIISSLAQVLAALQDLVPAMYAAHEMWSLAGEGGDFTLFDTLRATVILVMGDIIARVYALQSAEKRLLDALSDLYQVHQDAMELRRLKTKKAEYEPNWVINLRYVQNEYVQVSQRVFADLYNQAQELARDAWDYSLTKVKLDEKINRCKSLGEALCGNSTMIDLSQTSGGDFSMSKIVNLKQKDWIGGGRSSAGLESPLNTSFPNLASETLRFRRDHEAMEKEQDEIRKEFQQGRRESEMGGGIGLGGDDLEEEELVVLDKQETAAQPEGSGA